MTIPSDRSIPRRVLRLAILLVTYAIFAAAEAAPGGGNPPARNYASVFSALEQADAVVEGARDPKRILYVFFDANCYYCHLTWKALQPYEKVGLQARWVPVAYQKPSSVGRAAAIMQARDRAAALRENETGYRVKSYDGGIAPAKQVPAALAAQLKANTQLMARIAPGTPVMLWQDAGGAVRVEVGVPRLSKLPAITGLPEQKNDDPELAGFR